MRQRDAEDVNKKTRKKKHERRFPYMCEICCAGFYYKSAFEDYNILKHEEGEVKLADHVRRHQGSVKFQCSKCPMEKSMRKALREHGNLHKDCFRCVQCQKTFNKKCNLDCHTREVHLKEKKWVCKFLNCIKAYSRKQDLEEHMHSHDASNKS